MEAIDLNLLLEQCAETGDLAGVEKIVQASLSSKRTLELIRDTKQYQFLVVLHTVLIINKKETKILAEMYFNATIDGDNEACGIISCFHVTDAAEQSRICAKKGHPFEILGERGNLYGYIQGLIDLDDLERFQLIQAKYADRWVDTFTFKEGEEATDVRLLLAPTFAPKILDYIGYDSVTLSFYLLNISFHRHKQLLHHIWNKEHTQTALTACLFMKSEEHQLTYLRWILKQGVPLRGVTWLVIKREIPDVYAQLAPDV